MAFNNKELISIKKIKIKKNSKELIVHSMKYSCVLWSVVNFIEMRAIVESLLFLFFLQFYHKKIYFSNVKFLVRPEMKEQKKCLKLKLYKHLSHSFQERDKAYRILDEKEDHCIQSDGTLESKVMGCCKGKPCNVIWQSTVM